MWNNKKKAVTFSFDDGVTQDKRLIELFNKYNVKGTFNINSAYLGTFNHLTINNKIVDHNKITPAEVKSVYGGHEIAVHTLSHPLLTKLTDDTIIWQVENDRLLLEKLSGQKVTGMAYPCGGTNCDKRVADIIRNNTGITFSRTIVSSYNFELPEDKLMLNPSCYYIEKENLFNMGRKFLSLNPDKPKMFYIWGHSYEMDAGLIDWKDFEEFLKMISGKDDIFYGTNSQVLNDVK